MGVPTLAFADYYESAGIAPFYIILDFSEAIAATNGVGNGGFTISGIGGSGTNVTAWNNDNNLAQVILTVDNYIWNTETPTISYDAGVGSLVSDATSDALVSFTNTAVANWASLAELLFDPGVVGSNPGLSLSTNATHTSGGDGGIVGFTFVVTPSTGVVISPLDYASAIVTITVPSYGTYTITSQAYDSRESVPIETEATFLEPLLPIMTSNVLPTGYTASASSVFNSIDEYAAWRAFNQGGDPTYNGWWSAQYDIPATLTLEWDTGAKHAVAFGLGFDFNQGDPRAFSAVVQLKISGTWTTVYTFTNYSGPMENGVITPFVLDTPVDATGMRISISEYNNGGPSTTGPVYVQDFQLFGDGSESAVDTTPPEVVSATIDAAGTSLTIELDEAVTIGAGGNGGVALSLSGGAATATYASGSGTTSLAYSISRNVVLGETGTVDYTQPVNGWEDAAGNDVVTFAGQVVTNNSTYEVSAEEDIIFPTISNPTISSDGETIVATLSELNCLPSGGTLGFNLYGGTNVDISNWTISDDTLTLNLNGSIQSGTIVSYNYISEEGQIRDASDNFVQSFTGSGISNISAIYNNYYIPNPIVVSSPFRNSNRVTLFNNHLYIHRDTGGNDSIQERLVQTRADINPSGYYPEQEN